MFSVSRCCFTDIVLHLYGFGQEGVNESPSDPPSELSKDLLEINPLHGKNFWKPSLPTSWKIKRGRT